MFPTDFKEWLWFLQKCKGFIFLSHN